MFIEHASYQLLLLAPAERNRLAYHCRKHCAPLERGSCSPIGFYKHLAPLEPGPTWLRLKAALCLSGETTPKTFTTEAQRPLRSHREDSSLYEAFFQQPARERMSSIPRFTIDSAYGKPEAFRTEGGKAVNRTSDFLCKARARNSRALTTDHSWLPQCRSCDSLQMF
jgi:hypothetical protein